jgi:hypothetical protein
MALTIIRIDSNVEWLRVMVASWPGGREALS